MSRFVASAILATGLFASGVANAFTLKDAVMEAQMTVGGEAFDAEAYREGRQDYFEVEVLSGNEIYEVVFDANGKMIEKEVYKQPKRAQRVAAALERANLTLIEAKERALQAKSPALQGSSPEEVIDAEIVLNRNPNRNGQRFEVYVRTPDGVFEVIVNARNGRIIRIERA